MTRGRGQFVMGITQTEFANHKGHVYVSVVTGPAMMCHRNRRQEHNDGHH